MSLQSAITEGVGLAFNAIDELCVDATLHMSGNREFDYGSQIYIETVTTESARVFVQEGDANALRSGSRMAEHGVEYIKIVYVPRRMSGVDKIDIGDGPRPFRIRETSDFLTVIDVDA